MYREIANAAKEYNIGLKQNGFGERYDTWDSNTNTSYLFKRFQGNGSISLTHETGGQIYRDTIGAMGHPISILNRALLNHVDYLFLYNPDLLGRHIRPYFNTFSQQMGNALITNFYCHLGDYSIINEHSPTPVEYKNKWLGIRQETAARIFMRMLLVKRPQMNP
ncbi:MAG: hypothetical protein ACFCU1_02690 [Sumerlaeia bacterium]